MAQIRIPYQGLTFDFPDEGVPFYSTNGNPETPVAVRRGNTIYQISAEDFRQLGGDVNQLKRWNLVDGELQQAIQAVTKQPMRIQQTNPGVFSPLIKQAPEPEQVYTQTGSPQNPQGIKVVEDRTGQTVNESPSTKDALLAGGATEQQAEQLGGVASALPYTPEQVSAAKVPGPVGPIQEMTAAPAAPATQTASPQQILDLAKTVGEQLNILKEKGYGLDDISTLPQNVEIADLPPKATAAQTSGTRQVTLNGEPVTIDERGDVVSVGTQSQVSTAQGAPQTGVTNAATGQAPAAVLPTVDNTQFDAAMAELLKNPSITADQKTALQTLFQGVSTNDRAKAEQMVRAFNTATAFSSPIFKAQVALVTDALSRSFDAMEGDLEFQVNQKNRTLENLRQNTAASKDFLSFQNQQQLKNLERELEQDLETNAQNLASVGKTSSSVRTRAERILKEQNQGLVESSKRKFSFDTGNLSRGLSEQEQTIAEQIKYLQDKATQDRIGKLREAETQVGSTNLASLGYTGLLGGVGGDIPARQVKDALAYSGNFVF